MRILSPPCMRNGRGTLLKAKDGESPPEGGQVIFHLLEKDERADIRTLKTAVPLPELGEMNNPTGRN